MCKAPALQESSPPGASTHFDYPFGIRFCPSVLCKKKNMSTKTRLHRIKIIKSGLVFICLFRERSGAHTHVCPRTTKSRDSERAWCKRRVPGETIESQTMGIPRRLMHVTLLSPAECKNAREARKAKAQTTPASVARRQPMLPPCLPPLASFRSRKELHLHREALQQPPEAMIQSAKRPRIIKSASVQAEPPRPAIVVPSSSTSRRTAKITEIIHSSSPSTSSSPKARKMSRRGSSSSADATGSHQQLNPGANNDNMDVQRTGEVGRIHTCIRESRFTLGSTEPARRPKQLLFRIPLFLRTSLFVLRIHATTFHFKL
jgi:hypothetical protein